jgi:glycosyltransferase involved in cell wall biosynthesis
MNPLVDETNIALATKSDGKVLLFVINVSWFFISHRLPVALEALKRGYSVHLATQVCSTTDRRQLVGAGIRIHDISVVRGSFAPLSDLRLFYQLYKLCKRLMPDIVHAVTMKPVFFGGLAAKLARVPSMVSAISGLGYSFAVAGPVSALRKWLLLRALRNAFRHPNSIVIFQNPEDRKTLVEAGVVGDSRAAMIRGSGVDSGLYPAVPEPPEPVRVLLASRMLKQKGVEDFVRAATLLRVANPGSRFLLAGGTDAQNPGSIAVGELRGWQASGAIEWLGHCTDMPTLLASVHIVCLPTYYGEGVPKILLEAAAAGRAIVATDIAGCREAVTDGVNGLLVPARNVTALVAAIQSLMADPDRRRKMGVSGRSRAKAEFELSSVVNATMKIYERLEETSGHWMKH